MGPQYALLARAAFALMDANGDGELSRMVSAEGLEPPTPSWRTSTPTPSLPSWSQMPSRMESVAGLEPPTLTQP